MARFYQDVHNLNLHKVPYEGYDREHMANKCSTLDRETLLSVRTKGYAKGVKRLSTYPMTSSSLVQQAKVSMFQISFEV